MSTERLILSEKYKAFLQCDAPVEFLEGTTAAGKTTVGLFKFMLKVAQSPKKLHILAADDTGAAEKNIINKDLGILDDFGPLVEYKGNGSGEYKMPHLLFHTSGGDKIIFVVGYGNKRKWKDALGGQYGCLYIDEINTADIDFVREAAMRCDYLLATLNPDDPNLDVYKEYINCSRPLPEWADETPKEILPETELPWYRVRKSWTDAKSQIGAYHDLEKAKTCADQNPGYSVFDESGKAVYMSVPTKEYKVQIGSFTQKSNAEKLFRKAKKAGFDVIVKKENGQYKVQCGSFTVKGNADALAKKLKAAGFAAIIK